MVEQTRKWGMDSCVLGKDQYTLLACLMTGYLS